MTIYEFWERHNCTLAERKETGMYLAFVRMKKMLRWLWGLSAALFLPGILPAQ